jgi:predicted esterase
LRGLLAASSLLWYVHMAASIVALTVAEYSIFEKVIRYVLSVVRGVDFELFCKCCDRMETTITLSSHNTEASPATENVSLSLTRQPPPSRLVFEESTIPNEFSNRVITKPTIIMLHGWAQNVHIFSNRSKKLVKRLIQAGYRVIFLQAPHRLPPKSISESNRSNNHVTATIHQKSREYAYAWFVYNKDDPSGDTPPLPSPTGHYHGMKESLELLKHEIQRIVQSEESDGPTITTSNVAPIYLLGFSQGAVLTHKVATMVCCHPEDSAAITTSGSITQASPSFRNPWNFVRKCILVSGFPFRESSALSNQHGYLPTTTTTNTTKVIPSMHVLGTQDARVSSHLTRQVYLQEECFQGRYVVWEHTRGHVLPTDQAFCKFMLQFLQD